MKISDERLAELIIFSDEYLAELIPWYDDHKHMDNHTHSNIAAALRELKQLRIAARQALSEMCRTSAPRNSFTDAVDALDAALCPPAS